MQQGILHLHNFFRWIVLLFMLLTLIRAIRGMGGNTLFTKGDRKTAMFMMISADIQLVLGLVLYVTHGWLNMFKDGAEIMSNPYNRYFAFEHFIGMVVGIILIHIGYAAVKKNTPDKTKFKNLFWFTFIALLIILAMIPWPGRELVGRPLFPGM